MDRLEDDLEGRAKVLRVDMLSAVGRAAARQYGIRAVPTLLLFDGNGEIILRQVGTMDTGTIRAQVAELTGP